MYAKNRHGSDSNVQVISHHPNLKSPGYDNPGFRNSQTSINQPIGAHPVDYRQPSDNRNTVPKLNKKDDNTFTKSGLSCVKLTLISVAIAVVILGLLAFLIVYFIVLPKNEELPTARPPSSQLSTLFEAQLTRNINWDSDLNDKNSAVYKRMSGETVRWVDTIYRKGNLSSDYDSVRIEGFSQGSVKITLLLFFKKKVKKGDVENELRQGLSEGKNSGDIPSDVDNEVVVKVVEFSTTVDTGYGSTSAVPVGTTPPPGSTSAVPVGTTPPPGSTSAVPVGTTPPPGSTSAVPVGTTPPPVATCEPLIDSRCKIYNYNQTGVPNILGRLKQGDNQGDFSALLTLGQSGCFPSILRLACHFLYPQCRYGQLLNPCRSYCYEFRSGCHSPMEGCDRLLDDDDSSVCVTSSNLRDEQPEAPPTNPCGSLSFRCGDGTTCVPYVAKCDNKNDCPDASDEMDCGKGSLLDCDFEDGSFCNYDHLSGRRYTWQVEMGTTQSVGTGPHWDHTTWSAAGKYLLAEASGQRENDTATVTSPRVMITEDHCLRFFYHMRGSQVKSLQVNTVKTNADTVVWRRVRHQGDAWRFGQVTLPAGSFSVKFEATRGDGFRGDIAIDDISFRPGKCVNEVCAADEFACQNGHCVLTQYQCNGLNECGDYSDETGCTCKSDEYQCNMGMCIPSYQRCDGNFQCPDSSDELECKCPFGQHQCPDGNCIMREWLCDRQADCSDGSDELNCGQCSENEFVCGDQSCVPISQHCDGVSQCSDGLDEADCVNATVSNVVQVYRDGSLLPVCADTVTDQVKQQLCQHMGKRDVKSSGSTYMVVSGKFVRVGVVNEGQSFLQSLTTVNSCAGNRVLTLRCTELECGVRSSNIINSYIINGQDAIHGEWPWHVAILQNLRIHCGGTLITQNHVLTAAHCLEDVQNRKVSLSSIQIKLGMRRIEDNEGPVVKRSVKKYYIHPSYQRYYWGYDAAILLLNEEVPYTDYIRPACLPRQNESFPLYSLCYTSGFGYINASTLDLPSILQKAKMKLWTNEECTKGYYGNIQNHMICAGYSSGYITNCIGDSGGPLVCKPVRSGPWELAGVFSFVPDGCQEVNRPSVFGRVQSLLPWIDETLECAFTCDNGNCIYAEEDLCNGVNDCGDKSDEERPCSPSVTCDFEHPYLCGYQNYVISDSSTWQWTKNIHHDYPNHGPTVDHTFGNSSGHFMYAMQGQSVFMSPMYDKNVPQCMSFQYNMRGSGVGTLRIYRHDSNSASISRTVSQTGEGDKEMELKDDQGDIWWQSTVDLPAGTYFLTFEVEKPTTSRDVIAIDDIELRDGVCRELACLDNKFKCDDTLCFPEEYRCNFHEDCYDQTDELVCPSKRHTCDFENFAHCRFEQDNSDDLEWEIRNSNRDNFNRPNVDASTSSGSGFYAYLSAIDKELGNRARMTFMMRKLTAESCLSFKYNIYSESSLKVLVNMGQAKDQEKWEGVRKFNDEWVEVEVPLDPGVDGVTFQGTIGPWELTDTRSYLAIDDVVLTSGRCQSAACKDGQIRCSNGQCISAVFWCDGFDNCGDRSDEPVGCSCREEQFQCNNGLCIPGIKWCDETTDCGDKSDEPDNCSCESPWTYRCPGDEEYCINLDQVCNGWNDCGDWSDESNCSCSGFRCSDGRCIQSWQYCDGRPDCSSQEDEPKNCECRDDGFKCAAGNCVPRTKVCDGVVNCQDMSDETNCSCPSNWLKCDNKRCMPQSKRCDGFDDCGDGTDEKGCTCATGYSRCDNGICVSNDFWCDGQDDCGDESDEKNCQCAEGEVQCPGAQCIEDSWRCDGNRDCADGWDENGCDKCNPSTQFTCRDYTCVPKSYRCDGSNQCPDTSDEDGCVQFSTATDTEDVVQVYRDGSWLPVCAQNWQTRWSDNMCTMTGQRPALYTSEVSMNAPRYLTVPSSAISGNYRHSILQSGSNCPNNKVLKIACQEEVCGTRSSNLSFPSSYIIGGEVAHPGAWPWMVSINYLGSHWCGGVLIDSQWVVSAAHCFYYNKERPMTDLLQYYRVVIGTNNLSDKKRTLVELEHVALHPDHELKKFGFNLNDIALIKLKTPVPMNDYVRTVCSPPDQTSVRHYRTCFITGWGYTNKYTQTLTNHLREAKFKVWKSSDCQASGVWGPTFDADKMLCAGYSSGNIAACNGDSGSPLMCLDATDRWRLLGIVSHGPYECGTKPSVLMNVPEYMTWIRNTMKNNR